MKSKNLIIGAALLGTAGYLYFKNVIKKKNQLITDAEIKAKQDAEAAQLAIENAKKKAALDAQSIANKKSFSSKISVIQQFLGVNPDGIVGPNTIIALNKRFPKYVTITKANVDFILGDMKKYNNIYFKRV